ncbi:hypothetical protein F4805DRAFT_462126 [Annulohypoxylon moriforme]|nr:hypothetical protein F4805DRAFT_462126 [Annulohypoxylon moriforme]
MKFIYPLFVFYLLVWFTSQQDTVFRFNISARKPTNHPKGIAEFLRDPEKLPIYIPIPLLDNSIATIPEMLQRRNSKHLNPAMGLYPGRTKPPRRPYPWVEEPTIFDLIKQFNTKKEGLQDPIELLAVCKSWEDPPRVFTRIQMRAAKAYRVDPCDMMPLYCMERVELVPTIGSAPFVPPKCAAEYAGMGIFAGMPMIQINERDRGFVGGREFEL